VAIIALAVVGAVRADIMSLNLHQYAGGVQKIDGAETFGVASLGTDVGNWNNKQNVLNASNLILDDGSTSTIGYTAVNPGGRKSFNAAYDNTAMKSGLAAYASPASVTVTNLNANFSGGYYAIVYLAGYAAGEGASISDGTSTYYWKTADPDNATLVQTLDVDNADGYDTANYAVFGSAANPLSSDSVTFTLDNITNTGSAALGGLQIVAIPEPGTVGLMVVLAGAMAWIRRRFML
jgi:hypothetical protein